ncbi:MAG: tetratricopeptide repeat protein [Flavobacteriaceae bacterium]|nr:tetratricopeptide repeat protein [Flavobacteriaceae bacterium]
MKPYHNAMLRKFIVILFFISAVSFSQNSQLADNYFRKGEYEKATTLYKQLYKKNKVRRDYFKKLLSCYQLTENFESASTLLNNHQKEFPKQVNIIIEIGYNLQLQHQQEKAIPFYEKALQIVESNSHSGYLIGRTFQENHLLDYALKAYKKAMELNPDLNYDAYIAFIYGEKADIENMFDAYLNMVEKNENFYPTVQRYAGMFITDDSENANNILFRKLILKRLQKNPNNSWNKLLSWLYMQQKDYNNALIQEIALYKRDLEDLSRIADLGDVAFNNKDYETSKAGFTYILENTQDSNLILNTHLYLLEIAIATASSKKEYENVEQQFLQLFTTYGNGSATLNLKVLYANFLAFKKNKPDQAITILKEILTDAGSQFQYGTVKLKLGDILVYTNKFNRALINYSQVQTHLKNSTLAQTARFKVAQTSYFKGDFKWALTQLKVLKKSTSQLIANDALDLSLLISDNIVGDTIHDALKTYANAELLAFQNKNKQAIDTLSIVLEKFKGRSIEDEALFKQAELFTIIKKYKSAENNYLRVIELQKDGILVDDAYFNLANLYENKFNNIEKAKEMYQKIIFEFPSSIYLVDARKRFRKLRGDKIK